MNTPALIEAWLALMAEAMRGSVKAQEAMKLLTGNIITTDYMHRWLGQFMPGLAESSTQAKFFAEWLEEWWKTLGVVPRYRYLELLERNEELRRKLEACEKRNAQALPFTTPVDISSLQEETQKAIGAWSAMMDGILKAQAEMFRHLLTSGETIAKTAPPAENEEKAEGKAQT